MSDQIKPAPAYVGGNVVDMIAADELCDHCGACLGEWKPDARVYCGNERWSCFHIMHAACEHAHRDQIHHEPDDQRLHAWKAATEAWRRR